MHTLKSTKNSFCELEKACVVYLNTTTTRIRCLCRLSFTHISTQHNKFTFRKYYPTQFYCFYFIILDKCAYYQISNINNITLTMLS